MLFSDTTFKNQQQKEEMINNNDKNHLRNNLKRRSLNLLIIFPTEDFHPL